VESECITLSQGLWTLEMWGPAGLLAGGPASKILDHQSSIVREEDHSQ
jgi:hypothetical protein